MRKLLLSTFVFCIGCFPAYAGNTVKSSDNGDSVGVVAMDCFKANGQVSPCVAGNPLAVVDGNNAAFQGVVPITPGTPVASGRSLGFVLTAGGNVTLTMADASTITINLASSPQLQTLPLAVTNVALGTGTAGIFWNLK